MNSAAPERNTEQDKLAAYMAEGKSRALALNNRGPIHRTASGEVDPAIIDAYWHHGFYVFENVFSEEELRDLETDFKDILERLPTDREFENRFEGSAPLWASIAKAKISTGRSRSVILGAAPPSGRAVTRSRWMSRHPVRMRQGK